MQINKEKNQETEYKNCQRRRKRNQMAHKYMKR